MPRNKIELTTVEAENIARTAIAIGNRDNPMAPKGDYDAIPFEMRLQIQQGIVGFIKALEELGWTVTRP
jgi:hypothetical protein